MSVSSCIAGLGCQDGCRKWKNGRLTWKRSLGYIIVAVNFCKLPPSITAPPSSSSPSIKD